MQIVFESFLTAPHSTGYDGDFVSEIRQSANERPDMNGAAALPPQINARIVTQIKNLHLAPTFWKRDSNCAELRSIERSEERRVGIECNTRSELGRGEKNDW